MTYVFEFRDLMSRKPTLWRRWNGFGRSGVATKSVAEKRLSVLNLMGEREGVRFRYVRASTKAAL